MCYLLVLCFIHAWHLSCSSIFFCMFPLNYIDICTFIECTSWGVVFHETRGDNQRLVFSATRPCSHDAKCIYNIPYSLVYPHTEIDQDWVPYSFVSTAESSYSVLCLLTDPYIMLELAYCSWATLCLIVPWVICRPLQPSQSPKILQAFDNLLEVIEVADCLCQVAEFIVNFIV